MTRRTSRGRAEGRSAERSRSPTIPRAQRTEEREVLSDAEILNLLRAHPPTAELGELVRSAQVGRCTQSIIEATRTPVDLVPVGRLRLSSEEVDEISWSVAEAVRRRLTRRIEAVEPLGPIDANHRSCPSGRN